MLLKSVCYNRRTASSTCRTLNYAIIVCRSAAPQSSTATTRMDINARSTRSSEIWNKFWIMRGDADTDTYAFLKIITAAGCVVTHKRAALILQVPVQTRACPSNPKTHATCKHEHSPRGCACLHEKPDGLWNSIQWNSFGEWRGSGVPSSAQAQLHTNLTLSSSSRTTMVCVSMFFCARARTHYLLSYFKWNHSLTLWFAPLICCIWRTLVRENEKGFADIGYHVDMYGNSSNRISTPQLDKLAYSGIRLENYYIQPVCVRLLGFPHQSVPVTIAFFRTCNIVSLTYCSARETQLHMMCNSNCYTESYSRNSYDRTLCAPPWHPRALDRLVFVHPSTRWKHYGAATQKRWLCHSYGACMHTLNFSVRSCVVGGNSIRRRTSRNVLIVLALSRAAARGVYGNFVRMGDGRGTLIA